jgi:HK97 family phage portal protein
VTLIASDIAKLRVRLVELDNNGIWIETTNPAFSPVLRKPNGFQTRIQFWEYWMLSKLLTGNTYALKARDPRPIVTRLYILDPRRVLPLIADDGSIFYELTSGDTPGLEPGFNTIRVPAREIIHDRFNCVLHPLIGTSPLIASGLAAMQGTKIQESATKFFANRAMPGGILSAPGAVSSEAAADMKARWDASFGGDKQGSVAVLGESMKFEPITMTAVDAQMIEQLKWTAEIVCSVFHVPPYKIGLGAMPTNNNVQSLNVEYYAQCLQSLIEAAEECLDEGLGLGWEFGLGVEFDVENLLRMDTLTQMEAIERGVRAGVLAPNEGRKRLELQPVKGGDTPYLQQQNFSLAALDERDSDDPFARPAPAIEEQPAAEQQPPDQAARFLAALATRFAELTHAA